nr:hypothetical protein [Tanacetum cinerariifolium]
MMYSQLRSSHNMLLEDDDDDDDEEEEEEEEKDKEEEKDHLALANSVSPPVHRIIAWMFVRAQTPTSLPSETEVARRPAIPTPPPSPLSPLLKAKAPPTSHPLPSSTPPSGTPPLLPRALPTSLPPLLLPSASHRVDVPEVTLLPRKRLYIALCLRFEVGESLSPPTARPTGGFRANYGFVETLDDKIRRDPEREVGYRIIDTWDEMVKDMLGTPAATDVAGLSQRMTDFFTTFRHDTYEIYGRLDDAHDDILLMSGQLNMLHKDRHAHACTTRLIESESRLSHEAWVQSMDASDITRAEENGTKRTTRSTLATTTPTTTTTTTTPYNFDFGTGVRRQAPPARLVTRNLMEVQSHYALNETITMMVSVLQNATSATRLTIWTIKVLQMPILLTTKGELEQVKKLHALSVEPSDISRGSVQSRRTTTVVIKVEMEMLQQK